MLGFNSGYAAVNVKPSGKTGITGSTSSSAPKANMALSGQSGFVNFSLPDGASSSTYTWVSGANLYNFQGIASPYGLDSADNKHVDEKVKLTAAACPQLVVTSLGDGIDADGIGVVTVVTHGTAGTALLLRGYEIPDGLTVPSDNPATPDIDERYEFIKSNALVSLRFENLLVGPFDYGEQCPLIIYFYLEDKNESKFFFAVDGAAKSKDTTAPVPPTLQDVVVSCGTPVNLPKPIAIDACSGASVLGKTTTVFPITAPGTTTVTWTFTDDAGNTSSATQKVIISGYQFFGFYEPISAKDGGCNPGSVAKNIKLGSKTPIKFDFKCGSTFITSGPAPIVRIEKWSNCNNQGTFLRLPAEYQNDWHINWDSSGPPWEPGIYKIVVEPPGGGVEPFVFINLKK